jgi:methionyl-tRNA formyltransferase
MRVIFFGTATAQSFLPLKELMRGNEVVAAVLPARGRGLRSRVGALLQPWRSRSTVPTLALLQENRIPVLRASKSELAALAPRLRALNADVICSAAFPWIVPAEVLSTAKRAALNFHPSLLPRHRGPLPLFWTYYGDDRVAGATVHVMDSGADTGAIVAQSSWELPRGRKVVDLVEDLRVAGANLLRDTVSNLDAALAGAQPQDETQATRAPVVHPGARMVRFDEWGAERVWHFLHGLFPFFVEPVGVAYRGVGEFETREPRGAPGTVTDAGSCWRLHCRDGEVELRKS